jgi:hypothetical protein
MSNLARTKAIKHHRDERPDLDQQMTFFEALWDAQDEIAVQAAAYTPADGDATTRALDANQTLFSLVTPTVPAGAYRDAVKKVADLMVEHAGLPDDQIAGLKDADLAAAITDEALAEALDGFDVFIQAVVTKLDDERLTSPLLAYILQEAMVPFLREPATAAMAAAGKYDWMNWSSGLCPICGTPASSAIVLDEGELQGGRRWLSCPTCRAKWEYARLRCVRCGSRDMKDLEYLYDESDPGHKIHTCKKCHGYLPVAFEKDLKIIGIPEVEEVVMVRLETVAAERGFTPLGDETAERPN